MLMKKSSFGRARAIVLPLLLVACGEPPTGGNDGVPVPPRVADPEEVDRIFGDRQTGRVGERLPRPIGIALVDENGNPVEGVAVGFEVLGGNGSPASTETVSDSNGIARTIWTLGTVSGSQQVIRAQVRDFEIAVDFTATATPGQAKFLTLIAGDGQSGNPSELLPTEIIVRVTDDFGNGVPNQIVKFSPATGNGRMTPTDMGAGSDGQAIAQWTLGSRIGEQDASIWAPGLTGSPVRIKATAQ